MALKNHVSMSEFPRFLLRLDQNWYYAITVYLKFRHPYLCWLIASWYVGGCSGSSVNICIVSNALRKWAENLAVWEIHLYLKIKYKAVVNNNGQQK